MKLEELAGALTELKEKLFSSISEDSAAEANENLLTELRKRLMAKQYQPGKGKAAAPSPKPIAKKLNDQQSKFLKVIPVVEKRDAAQVKSDPILLQKSGNGYTISIDSELPQQVKDLGKVNDADIKQYMNTITENSKKQLDQLL